MTIFYPIKGYNTYCGPAALATLLNITTDEAARRIRSYSGQSVVRGSSTSSLCDVLSKAGWQIVKMPPFARTTKVLAREGLAYSAGVYLLVETGHFRVLRRRAGGEWTYVDNSCKTESPYRGNAKRITRLFYLVPPSSASPVEASMAMAAGAPKVLADRLRFDR